MKYFNNIKNADELRKAYRAKCLEMHPDKGGSEEAFKEMQNEYETLCKRFEHNNTADEFTKRWREAEAQAEADRKAEEEREARRREEERKAREQEEREERERIEKAQEESRAAVRAWAHILERIPEAISGKIRYNRFNDKKEAAAFTATTKRNIKAVINHYFPGLKVNVSLSGEWYKETFTISWQDGPTEAELENIRELRFFVGAWYVSDPYADYGHYVENEGTKPWRMAYGSTLGDCTSVEFSRTLSTEGEEQAAKIAAQYFADYDPEKVQRTNEQFIVTFGDWCKFCDAFNVPNHCHTFEMLINCYTKKEEGRAYYSSLRDYLRNYVKVNVTPKEKAPEFAPKYGKAVKAILKALGNNALCTKQMNEKRGATEWQPLDIIAALLGDLSGVKICTAYRYSNETHYSPLSFTSYSIDKKRREKFAALGIEIKGSEIISITAELRAELEKERDQIEQQRREWQSRKNEPKAKNTTTKAEPKSKAEKPTEPTQSDQESNNEPPAEGLELHDIEAGGVAVVGSSHVTFKNRKAIKAHGATWNNDKKRWEATDTQSAQKLREWFATRTKTEATPQAEEETPKAEETAPQTEQTAQSDTLHEAPEISALWAAVADLLQTFGRIAKEAARFEGVTVPADTLKRWRNETEDGSKQAAEAFAEVCACLASLTPENRQEFDALGVIFWTLSEQLRNGYSAETITPAIDYARRQLFELIERTQNPHQAEALKAAFWPDEFPDYFTKAA